VRRPCPCRKPLGFLLAWCCVATVADPALADNPAPGREGAFAFEIKTCPRLPEEGVRHFLGLEIGDLLLTKAEGIPAERDRLSLRCVGKYAWVQATGPQSSAPVEQIISLDDFPADAAPRALALAGLELLATLSSTVRARLAGKHPLPLPLTAPTPDLSESHATNPAATRETMLGLAGSWRSFPAQPGAFAWGGQVLLLSRFGQRWRFASDAEAATARTTMANLGQLHALLLSYAASLGVRASRGALEASLGAGARVGFARLSGESVDPTKIAGTTVWHPWGGPMVTVRTVGRWGRFALSLAAELGYSLATATGRANGDPAIAVGGTWLALSLGGGFSP